MKTKSTRFVISSLSIFFCSQLMSQNVAINSTGALASTSAILDLSNTLSMAFLPPQVALTNVTVLAPVPAPGPAGLVVYSTTAPIGGGGVGLYYWDGAKWNYLATAGASTAWNIIGNAGTNPALNYAGTSDPQPFIIKTQGTERMRFLAGGGAGIGTTVPKSGVDVNGNMSIGTYAGVTAAPANGVIISGKTGIGNSAPNASAILDLTNAINNLGFELPNMTTAQRNAIAGPMKGLMIFNNTTGCINYWTGFAWENVACPTCTAAPAQPASITAPPTEVINTVGNVFSTAIVPGALGYNWSLLPASAGTAITSGQGTTSIQVSFGPAVLTYTLCVHDSNACGISANYCLPFTTTNCVHSSQTWAYSAGLVMWTVPACITQVTVSIAGAQGGTGGWTSNNAQNQGGNGGSVSGVLTVIPGNSLALYVGGMGGNGSSTAFGVGGWNGGGNGYFVVGSYWGGGGGGATDIRVTPYALANRVVVAGGGGGGSFDYFACCNYEQGGPGGAATGGCGFWGNVQCNVGHPGGGGTQLAGGAGGVYAGYCTSASGILGIGGNTCISGFNNGGGGGGGYYGGGGGTWGGGGGGSNYTGGLSTVSSNSQGTQSGNGFITIQW